MSSPAQIWGQGPASAQVPEQCCIGRILAKALIRHHHSILEPGKSALVTQRREEKFRLLCPPTGFLAPLNLHNSPLAAPWANGTPAAAGPPAAAAGSCGQPQLSLLLMQITAPTAPACTWGLASARPWSPARAQGSSPSQVPRGTARPAGVPGTVWLLGHAPGSNLGSSVPLTTGVRNGGSMGGCDRCLLHPLLTQGWWLWHSSAAMAAKFTNVRWVTSHGAKVQAPRASQSSLMNPGAKSKPGGIAHHHIPEPTPQSPSSCLSHQCIPPAQGPESQGQGWEIVAQIQCLWCC